MKINILPSIFLSLVLLLSNNIFAQPEIDNLEKQYKQAKKNKNEKQAIDIRIAIGDYYFKTEETEKAIKNYTKSLKLANEIQYIEAEAISKYKIGSTYYAKLLYEEALTWFEEALTIAKTTKLADITKKIIAQISEVKNKLALQKKATDKYEKFQTLEKEDAVQLIEQEVIKQRNENAVFLKKIRTLNAQNQLIELELKFKQQEVERNDLQINLLNKYNELKSAEIAKKEAEIERNKAEIEKQNAIAQKQQIIILYSSIGLVLLVTLVFLILRGYNQKRKSNKLLTEKNRLIEQKNKEITDSIHYAKKIQEAILTSSELCNQIIPNNFILFKPKDIVSGDFYWAYAAHKDIAIWTVADCTGHGVPGAFMNMIGSSLLNEIVIERNITDANLILDELKARIIKAFGQSGATGETRDGMDAALCVWNKSTNKLEYAGAYNPLYVIRNNKLIILEADRKPIGYHLDSDTPFSKQELQLENGDVIYLFSDGYVDQFGGEAGKKFSRKRFKELLLSIHEKPILEQKQILNKTIEDWKGTNIEQVDDICVIGVQINS